jgi:hypothetical protein
VTARRILLWTALAIAGLLVAVGVTTAATTLTSQRVGLEAEPLDAGDSLAPAASRTPVPTRSATLSPTADPTPTPDDDSSSGSGSDDDSGHGRGRGRGRSGGEDDD